MNPRIREHVISFVLIATVAVAAIGAYQFSRSDHRKKGPKLELLSQQFVSLSDPLHRAVLADIGDLFYKDSPTEYEALTAALKVQSEQAIHKRLDEEHTSEVLSFGKVVDIAFMFLKFLLTYGAVMVITYYGVETIAVYRFVKSQSSRDPLASGRKSPFWKRALWKTAGVAGGLVLFSPAYVIAYSVRTKFSTDDFVFMVLLATISNGLLMTYANKFRVFLTSESRKGYVMTAIVKNLRSDYHIGSPGMSLRAILHPIKRFDAHVFNHIFTNARNQFIPTIKEQAAFLITGLVIIEMALNIHGHLSYEMLRQLLFRNYDIVIAILLTIFTAVKLTELAADLVMIRLNRKYSNNQ